MLTYQVRPRVFRYEPGEQLAFPALCEIRFHFQPPQPFGTQPGGGRTAVKAVKARSLFNANSGQHMIESEEPLSPLDVRIEAPGRILRLTGTTLSVSQQFASLREMKETIEGIYFVFPSLVNIPFADPPYIERVDGKVGSTNFGWELEEWRMEFRITTQEHQEDRFAKAWERMGVLSGPHRRRLVAGFTTFMLRADLLEWVPQQVSSLRKLSSTCQSHSKCFFRLPEMARSVTPLAPDS